jgi:hypothetical protein
LDPTGIGWGGVCRGVNLASARPGKKNINGENAGVALKPPQPAPTTSTTAAIARDLNLEPTLTVTALSISGLAPLATFYSCRGKPYILESCRKFFANLY